MDPQVSSPDADPEAQVSGPKEDIEPSEIDSASSPTSTKTQAKADASSSREDEGEQPEKEKPEKEKPDGNHTEDAKEKPDGNPSGARSHKKSSPRGSLEEKKPRREEKPREEKPKEAKKETEIEQAPTELANGTENEKPEVKENAEIEPRKSGEGGNPPAQSESVDGDAEKPKDPNASSKPPMNYARRESFTQLLKNSWKDSLQRKDKSGKRQSSSSNLSSLPPSDDTKERSGSLSRRFGKAVLSGVNKLRGKSKEKEKDSSESESSDSEQEPEPEPDEETGGADSADSPMKRSSSVPLPSSPALSSPPQSPRRHSDPLTPLESILVAGPRDPAKPKNNIKFNEIVTVRRTWAKKDYDRKGEVTWKLTPERAIDIRNELNDFKKEMDIHEDSRCNTHFY